MCVKKADAGQQIASVESSSINRGVVLISPVFVSAVVATSYLYYRFGAKRVHNGCTEGCKCSEALGALSPNYR